MATRTKIPKVTDFVKEYKNVISPTLCDGIIKYYESIGGWNKSTFGTKDGLSPETNDKVDMNEMWISKKDQGGLYGDMLSGFKVALQKYTEEYPDIVIQHSTPFRLNKYSVGGFMSRHIDNIHHSHGQQYGFPHCTMLLYLNDNYQGGEIEMCNGLISKKPKAGTIVAFPSNFMYPHEVKPVTEGDRYTVMVWLM